MTPHGRLLRMRARALADRAGVAAALCCLVALGAGTSAGAAAGEKADGQAAPPGQAKKAPDGTGTHAAGTPAQQGSPQQPAKAANKQAAPKPTAAAKKPPPASKQPTAKKPLPPQARAPKRTAPPQAQQPPQARQPPQLARPAATGNSTAGARRSPATTAPAPRARQRQGARRTRAAPQRSARTAPRAGTRGAADRGARRTAAAGSAGPPTAAASPSRPGAATAPREAAEAERELSPVTATVRDIVEVVPDWMKLALAVLAALSLLLAGGYAVTVGRARSLARQRGQLLRDVGLLQAALLPPVPARIGALATSFAYRPADGPGAGGDFYDAVALPGGRAGIVLGDISGHGRDALERTAFMRYTLRAYLEAGLEPRTALEVAGRVIGDGLGGDFATVLLAVHDPEHGSLTYASAGHPAPIVANDDFEPVLAGTSPPIGIGERTGLRQTTLPLQAGTVACLYTDGLVEARTDDGLLGRSRLEAILAELGRDAEASELIERVAAAARSAPDDMATCLLRPTAGVTAGRFRTEQLELSATEADGPLVGRFLEECGVDRAERERAEREARAVAERFGGAVIDVVFGAKRTVEVLPRNVESLEAASLRAIAV